MERILERAVNLAKSKGLTLLSYEMRFAQGNAPKRFVVKVLGDGHTPANSRVIELLDEVKAELRQSPEFKKYGGARRLTVFHQGRDAEIWLCVEPQN